MGTKGRPFYRVVVAHSTSGRNSSFVEAIGTYNPLSNPKHVQINEERALHWLTMGAQPTETTAYLLNKIGVLARYFEQRPAAKKQYAFLDKRTSAMSVPSAIEQPASKKAKAAPAEAVAEPVPVAEPVAATETAEEPAEAEPAAPAAAEEEPVVADAEPETPAAVAEEEPMAEAPAEEAPAAAIESDPVAEAPAEESQPEAAGEAKEGE